MMKFRRVLFTIFFIAILTLYGCPTDDKEAIWFINNAEYDIVVSADQDAEFWKRSKASFLNIPAEKRLIYDFNGDGTDYFYIVILHPDTVAKYPWETIVKDDNALKKFGITRKELMETNYDITYP